MATKLDLPAMAKRLTNRREIVLPNIATTQAQADSLALIYLRAVRLWTEAQDRIVAVYERTLSELTRDSPADAGGSIDSVDAQLQRLVLELTPELRRWAFGIERVHRGRWIRNVFSATSIDLTTILYADDMAETVEASIEWNVALIRDVSDETRRKVSGLVFSGFQQRRPAREIAKDIREATGLARQRSLRIAADQTTKLGGQLNRARQLQAGLTNFRWRHSGKRHPREWHKERDGKVFDWSGDIPADDLPSIPPWCGCTAQGIVRTADE